METYEAVLSRYPIFAEENLDDALSLIDGIYEEGMSKSDLKEGLLLTVEIREETINEVVEIFFESK